MFYKTKQGAVLSGQNDTYIILVQSQRGDKHSKDHTEHLTEEGKNPDPKLKTIKLVVGVCNFILSHLHTGARAVPLSQYAQL